ncbi:MAG TPA: glutamate-cysteine ligase family protein [Dongiaceae bacterium]|nr:glutamate-cysteine ligase family protein [Dongiaceae bacterium]
MTDPEQVLTRESDLDGYFTPGSKPRAQWGVGLEYERFGLLADTLDPVPYDGPRSVLAVLSTLVGERGFDADTEDGHLLGAHRGGTRITLEPGCQLEMSGAVHRDLASMRAELLGYLEDVAQASRSAEIAWLGVGMQPLAPLGRLPWIPKKRYAIMREYLPTRGTRGHVMMQQTACIQANLDYGDERDAMAKMRAAMAVTPVVTALFAHSPLTEGRPNGMQSARAWAWRDTDRDRCGLLDFVFRDDAGFGDYLEWALDVPLFFVVRDGAYHPGEGVTFRRFIRDGFHGRRATVADFQRHLTTLFPEVRLKHYLEMRGADSADPASAMALAALWKGLLYDPAALAWCVALTAGWSFAERNRFLDDVCRLGPGAALPAAGVAGVPGARSAGDLFDALLDRARAGLAAQGAASESSFLDPLDDRAARGVPARRLLAAWDGPLAHDPRRLVAALARNTLLPGRDDGGAPDGD